MSKRKTKIAKIVIDIDGEKLELSPKQAKELRDILCDLYGDNVVEHHYHDRYRHWQSPYWVSGYTTTDIVSGTITTSSHAINEAVTSDTLYLTAVGE